MSLLVSVVLAAACVGQEKPNQPNAEQIESLIKKLGAHTFAQREAAGRELLAVGESALPLLRVATVRDDDLEIRRRAKETIRRIMLAVRKSKSTGLETVLIEEGQFQMGSPPTESGRRPDEVRHAVTISKPFLLGAYEVTQDEYQRVMKSNPSWFSPKGQGSDKVAGKDTGRFPVEQVSWFDAVDFCNRLSQMDGYEPYYKLSDINREGNSIKTANVTINGGNGYRLPTEAEWEYACRASTNGAFHFGGYNSGTEANLRPGPATGYGAAPNWPTHDRTTKVGSYPANLWQLYDMHGNAAEWCCDWFDKDYHLNGPHTDPRGPRLATHRVSRGGSWLVNERSCRSASRYGLTPDERHYYQGFRVARTP